MLFPFENNKSVALYICTVQFYIKLVNIFSQQVLNLVLPTVCSPHVPTCVSTFLFGWKLQYYITLINTVMLIQIIILTLWYDFVKFQWNGAHMKFCVQ